MGLEPAARRPVAAVVGLGIKVAWTPEELERAAALASRPVTLAGLGHNAHVESPERCLALASPS